MLRPTTVRCCHDPSDSCPSHQNPPAPHPLSETVLQSNPVPYQAYACCHRIRYLSVARVTPGTAPLLTLSPHLPTYCHSVDTSDWLMSCDNILNQCEDNPFVFEETRLRGFVSNGLKNEKVRFDDGFGMRSMFVRPTGVRCRALSCLSDPPRMPLASLARF